jgi:hypothetical protein
LWTARPDGIRPANHHGLWRKAAGNVKNLKVLFLTLERSGGYYPQFRLPARFSDPGVDPQKSAAGWRHKQ